MVEKVIRNGKVAVLVSSGYGAGWSTWADDDKAEIAMFHPTLVKAAEDGVLDIEEIAKSLFKDEYFYCGGWWGVKIEWVDKGSKFFIEEHDGSESLRSIEDLSFTA